MRPGINGAYIVEVWQRPLQWRHNGRDGVSNHQPHHCLLNRLFRYRSKKTSKLRVTGFCAGNSPETGEFPAQMVSNAENVSIWWRHHVACVPRLFHKLRHKQNGRHFHTILSSVTCSIFFSLEILNEICPRGSSLSRLMAFRRVNTSQCAS